MPDGTEVICGGGVKKVSKKTHSKPAAITAARAQLHQGLISDTLVIVASTGMPTIADKDNTTSVNISKHLAAALGAKKVTVRPAAQSLGSAFERHCLAFVRATFPLLAPIRPGVWTIEAGKSIAQFEQYAHLFAVDKVLRENPELRAALGGDYIIKPDIVISRAPESDAVINANAMVVDAHSANYAVLRACNGGTSLLHASISCKWTIRSDRVQNVRAEALNLIRNRKGHLPHVVSVTAEPLPSRLASLCLGTGDLNCVYHIALPELLAAVKACGYDDALSTLNELIDGRRLKDISDLPLELAV